MDENSLKLEDYVLRVHEKLNHDHVKLWLEPYHEVTDSKISDEAFNKLVRKYSEELALDEQICKEALLKLQNNALSKLKERKCFEETGNATIHVKVSGIETVKNTFSVSARLSDIVSSIRNQISEITEVPADRIKLIAKGLVLSDDETLNSQKIQNGSHVMAVILYGNSSEVSDFEKRRKIVEDTKADVSLLAGRSNENRDLYLQVTDQKGETLQLPAWERKALVTAMTLHEKGRAALKREDYALALVLLLEADHEFRTYNSELLKSVDNYAVLNLDIAWCYLNLQSVTQLPEADARLKTCEENFHRSYGPNLERLVALKGTSGNEAALFMRLHLLQGIILYHQNKRDQAMQILKRAESELNALKVDDESLSLLLELGFTAAEARLALRGAHGDVNLAVELINRKKEEKLEAKRKEREERLRKKLGMCADGRQYVEPKFMKQLTEMGYSEMLAIHALQEANNSVSDAIQYIQEHPETNFLSSREDIIQQVKSVGLDETAVKVALKKHNGNYQKAINDLLQNAHTFLSAGMNGSCSFWDSQNDAEELEKEKKAISRIADDLNVEAEDHLDLTLIQEEQFLRKYLDLL